MKFRGNVHTIAVLVAVLGMTGCGAKDESPAPVADSAPASVKPECDIKTLQGCTDQQKAALRLSGESLSSSTIKPTYKVREFGSGDKRD